MQTRQIPNYSVVHKWLVRMYGSASMCENKQCSGQSGRYNWAIKKGKKYEKKKVNFIQLCVPCHREYDKEKHKNFRPKNYNDIEPTMTMMETIKKAMTKIEDGKLYSPEDIHELGVILNTKLEPSMFTVYRLIKNGKLPAVNIGAGAHSRHFVKGEDLRSTSKRHTNCNLSL